MNENLDLTELLKDCPKGTKFYSTIFGEVEFIRIDDKSIDFPIDFNTLDGFTLSLTSDGRYNKDYQGECTFFPSKDQRDWSKWHRPFKDGDVITCTNSVCSFVAIFKETNTDITFTRYASLTLNDEQQFCTKEGWADFKKPRFATKKEKQKLFDAIKANGYRWDAETKTLEKLIVPKFKVGDTIQSKFDNNKFTITNIDNNEFYYGCGKNGCGKICEFMIPVVKQDNWELVPNKFDPKNLKPFDNCKYSLDKGRTWKFAQYWYIQDNYIVTDIEIELWQD